MQKSKMAVWGGMNRISLVGGMRGIDAASVALFGHGAREMNIAESAQIAAMLKAPTTYSPLKNPDKNIKRAKIVLAEMVRQKYISLLDRFCKRRNRITYW